MNSQSDKTVTVIRGVKYIVCSHYDGEKPIHDKIWNLIESAFESSAATDNIHKSLAIAD